MSDIATIGLDFAKNVFQRHAVDTAGDLPLNFHPAATGRSDEFRNRQRRRCVIKIVRRSELF